MRSTFTLSLQSAFTQNYYLKVNLSDGSSEVFNIDEIQKNTFDNISNIEEMKMMNTVLNKLKLFPSYPNPFNRQTTIHYKILEKGFVRINIYDSKGILVGELFSGYQDEGTYKVQWDGRSNSKQKVLTGLYFCQVMLNGKMDSKQMVYINQ